MLFCAAMKKIIYLLLSLVLLLPAWGNAQQLLVLRDGAQAQSASGYLQWLRDPDKSMNLTQVINFSAWENLPGSLMAGYTMDAVWLRVNIKNESTREDQWVVVFSNPLIDEVRLYREDRHKVWSVQVSGEDIGRSRWELDTRSVALPVKLEPGRQETLLIRVQTKNAMATGVELQQSSAFHDASRREYFCFGLLFGGYLVLFLFNAFFLYITREVQSVRYLLYIFMSISVEMLTTAFPQQLFDMPVGISDPLLGVAICISVITGAQFFLTQLDLPAVGPRLYRMLMSFVVIIAIIGSALVLSGHYGWGMQAIQLPALAVIVFVLGLAIVLMRRGHQQARFFLLVFGIFYASVFVSFLRNMGVLPPNLWTYNATSLGTFVHMLLMSWRLHWYYNKLRKEKEQAQADAIETIRKLNNDLEHQVERRTATLSREIEQRQLLEQELRDALSSERKVREEQLDFVTMVSHEFRRPLSIIDSTVQQMDRHRDVAGDGKQQNGQSLRNAVQRMTSLVDTYLTVDRMEQTTASFNPLPCIPADILQSIVAEWPSSRVRLSMQDLPQTLVCDKSLLLVALRNLLNNADRYAYPGSLIEVLADVPTPDQIRIVVRNAGNAIADDEIPRIFQKYYRGSFAQQKPGAGIGLYLVRRITDMHSGSITLECRDGFTSFCLLLPIRLHQTAAYRLPI